MNSRRAARALGTLLCIPVGIGAQDRMPEAVPDTLTLGWAVEAALVNYPLMSVAEARMSAAVAGGQAARAGWWPQLSYQAQGTRFQLPMLVRPLHQLDASRIEFDRTPVQGTLALDFPILDGGARRATIRGADAAASGASARLAQAETSVVLNTVTAFLDIHALRRVRSAERAQIEAIEAERDRARQFFDAGRAARVEVLRADAALSRAVADEATTAATLRTAEAWLGRLTGTGAGVSGRPLAPVAARRSPASRSSEPDSLHPVLVEAWSGVAVAEADRDRAAAQWIPTLGLNAGVRQHGTVSGAFSHEWQMGLALSYPLFTGFRRSREVRSADAMLAAARETVRLRRYQVEKELDEARAAMQEADARVAALERAVEQSAEVVRIEALALDAGAGVQRDYLDARAALLRAEASLERARHGRILARVQEAAALGRLDRAWIRINLETVR